MISSLQEFIASLENSGELRTVDAAVSTKLEIGAITRRASAYPEGGPALLFRRPDISTFPVATNLFGSRRRIEIALGLESLGCLTSSFATVLNDIEINGISSLGSSLANHPAISSCAPITAEHAPCREYAELKPNLLQLPFLQNWPDDGRAAGTGFYITLGQVITADRDGYSPNCGIYRCQIHDSGNIAIRWRRGSGAELHHRQFTERGERMPVVIALGGPPSLTLAAAWPLPEGLDELSFAGWLRGTPIPVVDCPHGPLSAPAEAEMVIEGFAEPDRHIIEGPFGNHTGLYDPAGPAAHITVTRITRRHKPIVPATVVGPPPQEDCWMMLGWERLLAALLPRMTPGVHDICIPLPWAFRQSAIIAIENRSPRMVREIAEALWQLPWFRSSRLLILVNSETSVSDMLKTAWKVVNGTNWMGDLIMDKAGDRLALDATGTSSAGEAVADEITARLILERWKEYGLP